MSDPLVRLAENFNPRTREGCDQVVMFGIRDSRQISIHAPVKGATSWVAEGAGSDKQFQSTHP